MDIPVQDNRNIYVQENIYEDILHVEISFFFYDVSLFKYGAVHILRNTKIGNFWPPPPPYVTDLVKIMINLYNWKTHW